MMTQPKRDRPARATWLVLVLFVVLALILTWPLVAHLSTKLPGTATWAFDESTFVWNIWYFKHSLLDLHSSPLHSDLIWHPLGIDLILYTYNFFNALVGMPLLLALNAVAASNITVLLASVLSGLGAYLLTLHVLRRARPAATASQLRAGALLAGVIYAFASNRAVYAALGHYDMVTTQWLPFYALYFLRTLHRPNVKNAVLAGLFFALAALAEMIFASFLALLSLILLLASWRGLQKRWRSLVMAGVAGLVAIELWSPVLIPIVREFTGGDYALEGWGESIKLSADAVGLVTPTNLNPLLGGNEASGQNWRDALRAVEKGEGRFGDINTVFLGWVTLALALAGAVLARRRLAAWTWSALIFGLFVLGPLLQVNGRYRFSADGLLPEGVTFPLPFALLHFIPFVNANRAPNRFSVLLMLALAVLAAYGVTWLLAKVTTGRREPGEGRTSAISAIFPPVVIAVLLAGLVILEHLAVPLPVTDARIPDVYRNIAAEEGDFAIMQLPLGWRNSFGVLGSEQTNLQYFQTGHAKRMIGGNISRAPAFKMAYFGRLPLFKAITELEMYRDVPPELDAAARGQAGALMSLFNVRYLVTTPPIPGRYPYQDTWQRTEQYVLDVLPLEAQPVWEADGYRVYRVVQPPVVLPLRLDLGTAGNEPYLGEGWDVRSDEQPYGATANWVTGKIAQFFVPLDSSQDITLRLALAPLAHDGAGQTLAIRFNDEAVLTGSELVPGWQTVEVRVPATATRQGTNRVQLEFAWSASPRQVFPDPASRALIGTTGVQSPANLEVHAFSEAFVTATGADGTTTDASAGRQGYNVAVFDEKSGKLLDKRGFDTAANVYEAGALASYLDTVPAGRIVVLATKGNGTDNLTPDAAAAIARLGSRVSSAADLQGQAHALVGIQGAAPGTAAEVIAPDAYLRVAGDFRRLAAAVDWVELDR